MEEVDGPNPSIDTKQLLLHIIGSVLGSDPRRVGSNPAGAANWCNPNGRGASFRAMKLEIRVLSPVPFKTLDYSSTLEHLQVVRNTSKRCWSDAICAAL